jgi:serine/threonine protein kinase
VLPLHARRGGSRVWREAGRFWHRYLKADLLDPDWPDRIERIRLLTRGLAYPVEFVDDGDHLLRAMRCLPPGSRPLSQPDAAQAMALGRHLHAAHTAGLCHADIHPKNVYWDGTQPVLIDWEPSLRQRKGQRSCWMVTPPFRHPLDAREGRLTERTDVWCFVAWSLQMQAAQALRFVRAHDLRDIPRALGLLQAAARLPSLP